MKEKKIIFVKTAERHAKNKHRKNGVFSPEREEDNSVKQKNKQAQVHTVLLRHNERAGLLLRMS